MISRYFKDGIWKDGFRRNHSYFLNTFFDLSQNGIDYYNRYNIGFEFKESFSKCERSIKIPINQLEKSHYIVFCNYKYNNFDDIKCTFYVIPSVYLIRKYFKNISCKEKKYCLPRPNSLKKNWLFKTKYIKDLVKYVNSRRV